jgi:acetyl esterase/lipase
MAYYDTIFTMEGYCMAGITIGNIIRMLAAKNEYRLDVYPVKYKSKFALICPGGAYRFIADVVEGEPFARALNQQGYTAFVLSYRVRKKARFPAPLEDLAKAVRYILDNADELNVEREGWSLWGSSAGGHLAASFGTESLGWKHYGLPAPGALVLIYPVITMGSLTHKGSRKTLLGKGCAADMQEAASVEMQITAQYPPTYLWCSRTDGVVDYRNSQLLADALKAQGIPHKLRIFESGRHSAGLGKGSEVELWFDEALMFWKESTAGIKTRS